MRPVRAIKSKGAVRAPTLTVPLWVPRALTHMVPTSLACDMLCVPLFVSLLSVTTTRIGDPRGQGCLSQLLLYPQGLEQSVVHRRCSISN